MSKITVDPRSRTPIYEQLISDVKRLIYSGELVADEALPSVRALAGELGINPNTIQRAYAALEADGVIYSLPARGSFVSGNTDGVIEARKKELLDSLFRSVRQLKALGCESDEIKTVFDLAWRKNDDRDK